MHQSDNYKSTEHPHNNYLTSGSYVVAQPPANGYPAPLPICCTPEALQQLLETVAIHTPETGAKGFGPKDKFGLDVVEFDEGGSARASGSVYAPDVEWGNQRSAHWLQQPDGNMKLWTGDIHSHPGAFGYPSGKSGHGLGDLGYVEEVFAANEAMQHFCLPILTNTGRGGRVTIHPWLVSRERPDRPLWAEFKVCSVQEFPERVFNPEWLARVAPPNVNVERLADLLDAKVQSDEQISSHLHITVLKDGVELKLVLRRGFPLTTIHLGVRLADGRYRRLPINWRVATVHTEPERRLANLCNRAAEWMSNKF